MKDDGDVVIIQALFGIGIGLALTAVLAFGSNQPTVALIALGLAVVGLLIVGISRLTVRRRRPSKR